MKILTICQYYYPEPFKINEICEEMVRRGNEVTVLTGLPNYPDGKIYNGYKFLKKRKEKINGVNVIRNFEIARRKGVIFRALNYLSFAISASIRAFFLKDEFDVIYVYQLSPISMAKPAITYKRKNKTKIVLYCLDLWPDSIKTFGIKENSKIYTLIDKYSKKIYSSVDRILISSSMFNENFKNLEPKYVPQYSEQLLSKKQNEKSDKMNFIFAGNIGKAQSIETIIKAANELKDKNNILFHIIGDGSELSNIQLMSKNYNLNNVIFHGRVSLNEMQHYYNLADAMLVTLGKDDFLAKTLPGKVQSCMATGNAIIGAANGEIMNVISKANCGYCVDAEDYKALATKIEEFSELSEDEKSKLQENAYNYYSLNFSRDKFIEKTMNALKEECINV